MELCLKYLRKTKGGRLENVHTFKGYCKKNKHIMPTAWLYVKETIKTPESEDIFGHVAIGNMLNDTNVIVKVFEKKSNMLKKELSILKNLTNHKINNIVKLICHFECTKQNKLVWTHSIKKPRALCNLNEKGNDKLYFLVMEYLPFGHIGDYFDKNILPTQQYISFVKQCMLCLIEMYDRFGLHHGDLHHGNVLIDFSDAKTNNYKIQNKIYKVRTHGCEPVFIDFGRASKSSSSCSKRKNINSFSNTSKDSSWIDIDDINWTLQEAILLLEILESNIRDDKQKEWTSNVAYKLERFDKNELDKCAEYICSL